MKNNILNPATLEIGQSVRLIKELYEKMVGVPHPHGLYFKPGLSGKITKLHSDVHNVSMDRNAEGLLKTSKEEAELCSVRLVISDYLDYLVTLKRSDMKLYFAPEISLHSTQA